MTGKVIAKPGNGSWIGWSVRHGIGSPEDIAAVVSFLFSEQAGWMTGRILHVDGGLSAARLL